MTETAVAFDGVALKTPQLTDDIKFLATYRGIKVIDSFSTSDGRRFYCVKRLGRGVSGTVYAAATSLDGVLTAVVKKARLRTYVDGTVDRENVDIEFLVAQVIRRRLGTEFARSALVCAEARYMMLPNYGFLVMPYSAASSLSHVLSTRFKPRLMEIYSKLNQARLSHLNVQGLVAISADQTSPARANASAILSLIVRLQHGCYELVRQLVVSVALLHSQRIYHCDIKPDNIVVDENLRLQLIDFGISAVGEISTDAAFSEEERELLLTNQLYETTKYFEDPLAPHTHGQSTSEWAAIYGRFDTFSVGKVMQLIFDPMAFDGTICEFPTVRQTFLMPESVFELIKLMTGEDPADRSPTLSLRRFQALATRITMTEVARRLSANILTWLANPDVSRYFA